VRKNENKYFFVRCEMVIFRLTKYSRTSWILEMLLVAIFFCGESCGPSQSNRCPGQVEERWGIVFGGVDEDRAYSVSIDKDGNIYIVGNFTDQADFGSGIMHAVGISDCFVLSLDSNGVFQWVKQFGGPGRAESWEERCVAIAVDNDSNVYLTGMYAGVVDFGGGEFESSGEVDGFILSLAPDGSYRWAHPFMGSEGAVGTVIAVQKNNIWLSGTFWGTIDLGSGSIGSPDQPGLFIALLDREGRFQWIKSFEITGESSFEAVVLDLVINNEGNAVFSGSMNGTIDLGGGPLSGRNSGFVASFDQGGDHLWSRVFTVYEDNLLSMSTANSIVTDDSSNVFVGGSFFNGIDFGSGPIVADDMEGLFIVSYNISGEFRWARTFSRRFGKVQGHLSCNGLGLDNFGDIVLVGSFDGSVDLGGGVIQSSGNEDIFVAIFGQDGCYRWSRSYGGSGGDDNASDVAVYENKIFMIGTFENSMNFGTISFQGIGSKDIFMVDLFPLN